MSDEQVTELLEANSGLHKNPLQITDSEREEVLLGIRQCYTLFKESYEAVDWDAMLSVALFILTDDYALIFPADHAEIVWDKQRVEQDIRKGKETPGLRMHNTLDVIFEELLSVERDKVTGVVYQATMRTTFITENAIRRQIIPRIDTFAHGDDTWKLQRTLSLYAKDK